MSHAPHPSCTVLVADFSAPPRTQNCDPPVSRRPVYWAAEKCTCRFFCQQSSFDSVHTGRSLP